MYSYLTYIIVTFLCLTPKYTHSFLTKMYIVEIAVSCINKTSNLSTYTTNYFFVIKLYESILFKLI